MFSLFNFSSIFQGEGVSRLNLSLCADAHGDRILLYHTTNFTVLILCSLIINYFVRLFWAPSPAAPGGNCPPLSASPQLRHCVIQIYCYKFRKSVRRQQCYDTIRCDTRCYFNVRSKADMSQLNLPHKTNN